MGWAEDVCNATEDWSTRPVPGYAPWVKKKSVTLMGKSASRNWAEDIPDNSTNQSVEVSSPDVKTLPDFIEDTQLPGESDLSTPIEDCSVPVTPEVKSVIPLMSVEFDSSFIYSIKKELHEKMCYYNNFNYRVQIPSLMSITINIRQLLFSIQHALFHFNRMLSHYA